MRFLFVLDPFEKLDLRWDTSLTVLRELNGRGHKSFAADAGDFWIEGKNVLVRARELTVEPVKNADMLFAKKIVLPAKAGIQDFDANGLAPRLRGDDKKMEAKGIFHRYIYSAPQVFDTGRFGLIFIRKNPPFDSAYLHLTYVLEQAAKRVPVVNHPQGIRDTNEKLSVLEFPHWIPETLVSSHAEQILEFQRKIKDDLVIKPLDEKGGEGVFLLKQKDPSKQIPIREATRKGKKFVLAQRFLPNTFSPGEKRILILNGKFAGAYEKRPPPRDFRANLGLPGAAFHSTSLTQREKDIADEAGPFLLKRKLYFAGLDVLNEKLIEINVTSPAGITEIMVLQPETRLVQKAADFLENCAERE